ncbi:TetR/AcrR family transcriptional regulator [Glutamicibacter ardleyensis]|uniref:TetR/AcrR family transcriptional regulator n=1 Tax=Glutamicibacter ardleyensis TaxID=225894 RepID=UPI003FB7A8A7
MSDAPNSLPTPPAKRGRGRPRKDSNWATFSRDELAARALHIAGNEGFSAVTMHRLAAEFSVTPRALYNYVADRQEIINLAVAQFLEKAPFIDFDPENWRDSVGEAYNRSREVYRMFPRATLVGMEESVTADIGPRHTELLERLLKFFVDIGLPLKNAVSFSRCLEQDVLGFALKYDYPYDRAPEQYRDVVTRVVAERWLDNYPEVDAPMCRASLELPEQTSDEIFAELVEMRILSIEVILARN